MKTVLTTVLTNGIDAWLQTGEASVPGSGIGTEAFTVRRVCVCGTRDGMNWIGYAPGLPGYHLSQYITALWIPVLCSDH